MEDTALHHQLLAVRTLRPAVAMRQPVHRLAKRHRQHQLDTPPLLRPGCQRTALPKETVVAMGKQLPMGAPQLLSRLADRFDTRWTALTSSYPPHIHIFPLPEHRQLLGHWHSDHRQHQAHYL